ncbi:sigma-70 family RNA polymerase sigma factor [bacterium]|nr:sigma-70 family RNA polymerase sigma factor [bacterium]
MTPNDLHHLLTTAGPHLRLVAASWVGDQADDILQEAFLQLAARRTMPDDPGAWLYVVTRRLAVKAARKDKKRRFDERMFAESKPASVEADPAAKLDARLVAEALDTLEPELAEIVVAHLWGGTNFEKIGEATGISAATAWRRYQEALNRLQEIMGITR